MERNDDELLGHVTKLNLEQIINFSNTLYLSHHGVVNEHSSIMNLRVVFDGSCKTSKIKVTDFGHV